MAEKLLAVSVFLYIAVFFIRPVPLKALFLYILDLGICAFFALKGAPPGNVIIFAAAAIAVNSAMLFMEPGRAIKTKPPAAGHLAAAMIFAVIAAAVFFFISRQNAGFSATPVFVYLPPAAFLVFTALFTAGYLLIKEDAGDKKDE